MSGPVMTAMTPGIAAAADVSTDRMFAWAYGLRRMAICAIAGSLMSSRYRPLPVMKRASSTRLTGAPRTSVVIGCLLRLARSAGGRGRRHRRGRLPDRRDDVLVPGATADVPVDRPPDRLLGRIR